MDKDRSGAISADELQTALSNGKNSVCVLLVVSRCCVDVCEYQCYAKVDGVCSGGFTLAVVVVSLLLW